MICFLKDIISCNEIRAWLFRLGFVICSTREVFFWKSVSMTSVAVVFTVVNGMCVSSGPH